MAKRKFVLLRTARFTNYRKNSKHPAPTRCIPRVQPDVRGSELQNSFGADTDAPHFVSRYIVNSGGEQGSEQCEQFLCVDGFARNPQITVARQLLHRGGGIAGHEYGFEADLAIKEKALARLEEPNTHLRRYRPTDALMTFLQQL
jgi:hypothetical protein